MAIKMSPARLDQLNLATSKARNKASVEYKISLPDLRARAQEKFADDPKGARALVLFRETEGAEVIDSRHVKLGDYSAETQEDVTPESFAISRAVVACHLREVIEKQFHAEAQKLTDAQLGKRYLSQKVSDWEKVILEGLLLDRYEALHGSDALDKALESADGVDQIAKALQAVKKPQA